VRGLLDGFNPGDVMLADALYCNYFLIADLMARGVDVLFEQHGSRITDFRRGQSLGTRDHIVHWPKPQTRPEWMTPEQYAKALSANYFYNFARSLRGCFPSRAGSAGAIT
jgi:hypothetical protein